MLKYCPAVYMCETTYPKWADEMIGNEARGRINRGGVDLKSLSIKSKSVANELSNCKK